MNLDNVKQEDWIVGGLALLMVIALLFFPWYHISVSIGAFSASASRAAASSPYAIWGILALLTSLALLVHVVIELFAPQVNLPAMNGSHALTRLAIVGATGLLLVIKFLAHIGSFGWGFFVIVVAMIALAYFAFMQYNAAPAGAARGGAMGPGATPPAPPPPSGTATGTPGSGAPGAGAPGTGTTPGTPPPAPPPPGIGGSTPPPSGS